MTQDKTLLPCPGCGESSTRVIGGPGTKGGPQHWAGCDRCHWRTWGATEDEAIAHGTDAPPPIRSHPQGMLRHIVGYAMAILLWLD